MYSACDICNMCERGGSPAPQGDPLRERDILDRASASELRRRVVEGFLERRRLEDRIAELAEEVDRLRAVREPVRCADCLFARVSIDGAFWRCGAAGHGMRIIVRSGWCSDGRRRADPRPLRY